MFKKGRMKVKWVGELTSGRDGGRGKIRDGGCTIGCVIVG